MGWVYVYGPLACQSHPCEKPDYCQVPLNYSICMHTPTLIILKYVLIGIFSLIDSSVQVASLTVLGSIVAIEPGTSEITDILCKSSVISGQKDHHSVLMSESEQKIFGESAVNIKQQHDSDEESDYDDVLEDNADVHLEHTRTDVNNQMSWLLEICVRNLQHPSVTEGIRMRVDGNARLLPSPVPVRVESLQILTVLARNYFTLVMNTHLGQLMQLLEWPLTDGNVTISLHSGRVIDALGKSMKQCLQEGGKYKMTGTCMVQLLLL